MTAYLPIRAEEAGADIGLYFAADGIAIFLMRVPTGWLVDRVSSRSLILTGAGMTLVAIGMLLLPLTTPLLVVSGLLGGAGGGHRASRRSPWSCPAARATPTAAPRSRCSRAASRPR